MPLPPIPAAIAQVWREVPAYFDHPDAPPSTQAEALGRRLAASLGQHQALYVVDHRAGVVSYVAEGDEHLLGYPPAELGRRVFDLTHPDDWPLMIEASVLANRYVAETVRTPRYDLVLSVDYRLRHARGHWVRVLRHNMPLAWEPAGSLVAVAALLTDITAHKRTDDVQFHCNLPGFADYVRQQALRELPVALSPREQAVARLVLAQASTATIAEQLGISPETVKTHRRNFWRKVGSDDLSRLLGRLRPDDDAAN